MRFPLTGRIYLEKAYLNVNPEPCDWICFPKYCFNSEILVATFLFGQSYWIQNAYFLIENCSPWPSRIKSDASTPSELAVAPKSNRIEFGSAHEWSGVWKGPYTRNGLSAEAKIFPTKNSFSTALPKGKCGAGNTCIMSHVKDPCLIDKCLMLTF